MESRSTTSKTSSTHRNRSKTVKTSLRLYNNFYYAPTFFSTMKQQKLENLRQQGWPEEQVRIHETALQQEKILELYIILPEKTLKMWLRLGRLPASYIENGTEEKHSWYNFHTEIQYAINDFINLYLYYNPTDYPQTGRQLMTQDYFLTVVHTTERLLE
eukprot:3221514-Amphidinium_carterae.1